MPGILFALAILSAAPDGVPSAGAATSAHTLDSPTSPPPPSVQDPSRPYQGQILLADAVGWGVVLAGLGGAAPFTYLGVASLTLAAPGVHAARGHPGRALGSLGLRFGGLLLGGFVGASFAERDNLEGLGDLARGSMVGLVVAELIDISMLASGSRDAAGAQPAGPAAALTLVPVIAPCPGGGLLGVAAAF